MAQRKLNRAQQKKRQEEMQAQARARKLEKEIQRKREHGVHGIKVDMTKLRVLDKKVKRSPMEDKNSHLKISSGITLPDAASKAKPEPRYEGEMLEREKKAQKEIAAKRNRVAPAYNKGGYQYITDETDPSDLGRKK